MALFGDIKDGLWAFFNGKDFAGRDQGRQIGLGTAACEKAHRPRRHSEKLAEPVEDDQFNLRGAGRLQPDAGEEIGSRT